MENNTYIIGEIGQNHNGSADIAKLLIELISLPIEIPDYSLSLKGLDAIKLVKRDLKAELSISQMNRAYDNPHSFGPTYGEHRKFLELTDEQHFEIFKHAKMHGLDVVETLCAPSCLSLLKLFTPDYLKVASRDLTNIPLLQAMAETNIPIIVSTGMSSSKELDEALEVITKYHSNISILHCVSQYPTYPKNANLRTIAYLQKKYPEFRIGYSDHTIGISAPVAAIAMGAEIIEKHITIDRRMKGTDQAGSLGPDGIRRMVRDIRLTDMSMGAEDMFICEDSQPAKVKLERSIASTRGLKKGDIITEEDIYLLSPGDGIKWSERSRVIGKRISVSIPAHEIIYPHFIE